jgi:hypothetical protein
LLFVDVDGPLNPFRAAGDHAEALINGQRPDRMLGPVEVLDRLDGDVLLLGVGHHANTTIHLAEQRMGRSLFYRYAVVAPGVWAEVPNVSGESHRFDDLEPRLAPATAETMIGNCRARRIPARAVQGIAAGVKQLEQKFKEAATAGKEGAPQFAEKIDAMLAKFDRTLKPAIEQTLELAAKNDDAQALSHDLGRPAGPLAAGGLRGRRRCAGAGGCGRDADDRLCRGAAV